MTQARARARTPPYVVSARLRDLYQTTHNIHKGQTLTPSAGFEILVMGTVALGLPFPLSVLVYQCSIPLYYWCYKIL